jgi:hypothetical protein
MGWDFERLMKEGSGSVMNMELLEMKSQLSHQVKACIPDTPTKAKQ